MSIVKDISKTLSLSLIAALINLGFTPVIIKVVDPSGFYLLSTSLGISSIFVIFTTLKIDQVFQLKINFNNVKLFFYISILFSFLWAIGFFLLGNFLLNFDLIPDNYNFINLNYLKLTSLLIFCSSIYTLLSGICFRKKAFLLFGLSQIFIHLLFNLSVLIIKVNVNYNYLILIQALAYFAGSILLSIVDLRLFVLPKFRHIKNLVQSHRKHMLYPSLESLINTVGMYIPIFLLGYYYGPTNAGVFAFVVRILNLPISFISSNVGRPLLNFYKNDLNLSDRVSFEMKSVFYLRIVSSVFFPLFLFVYFLFDVFFQHEWHSSKWVAVTLVPWIFSLTLSTPFSPIMYAKGKFELSFNIQILLLIIRVLVLIVSGLLFDFYTALIFYSMVSSVMWLIFLNESLNLIFITKDYVKKNVIMNIFAVYYFLVELHRIYLNRKST